VASSSYDWLSSGRPSRVFSHSLLQLPSSPSHPTCVFLLFLRSSWPSVNDEMQSNVAWRKNSRRLKRANQLLLLLLLRLTRNQNKNKFASDKEKDSSSTMRNFSHIHVQHIHYFVYFKDFEVFKTLLLLRRK